MKDCIFHTPEGWKWNKFPDNPHDRMYEYDDAIKYQNDMYAYEKQVAELKASALEVANPEIFLGDERGNCIWINRQRFRITDNELYHWPGEVELVQMTPFDSGIYKAVLSLPKPEADLKQNEINTLRDQLSKEREKVKKLSWDLLDSVEQHQKERKMRKELVAHNINDFKIGDIVVGKSTGLSYIVTDHFGDHVIAVRTQHISNPSEWKIYNANP
jgi:ribosomal protein S17